MTKLLTTLFLLSIAQYLLAQSTPKVPRLSKTPIGNTGSFAYLPENKATNPFELSYSPDSSKVYTGDFLEGEHHFSVILVKFNFSLNTQLEKENMILNYLEYLKTSFNIVQSAGYGKGHTLESAPEATGVIDYWVDKDKDKWAIKAWADGNTLAVMMLYGATEYPIFNVQQMFLNGFRFK